MEQSKAPSSPCDAAGAATANAERGHRVERSEWRRPGGSRCCAGYPPLCGGQGARARFFAYFLYASKESKARAGRPRRLPDIGGVRGRNPAISQALADDIKTCVESQPRPSTSMRLFPVLPDTNLHVERHRDRDGVLHLMLDQRLHGLDLVLRNVEDQFVVHLQHHAAL